MDRGASFFKRHYFFSECFTILSFAAVARGGTYLRISSETPRNLKTLAQQPVQLSQLSQLSAELDIMLVGDN